MSNVKPPPEKKPTKADHLQVQRKYELEMRHRSFQSSWKDGRPLLVGPTEGNLLNLCPGDRRKHESRHQKQVHGGGFHLGKARER